jgi:hypothetical protein
MIRELANMKWPPHDKLLTTYKRWLSIPQAALLFHEQAPLTCYLLPVNFAFTYKPSHV